MQFKEFSLYLARLEALSARLEMTVVLAELFTQLEGDEVALASYLLEGRLVPQYKSLEFQLSIKMLIRSLARLLPAPQQAQAAAGLDLFGEEDWQSRETFVLAEYKKLGDIGAVAEAVLQTVAHEQGTSPLSIGDVYSRLTAIAEDSGEGSQERKVGALGVLLKNLDPLSSRYVARIIMGSMRLGFSTMTLLDALSWAMTQSKGESILLESAYQKKSDIGKLAQTYLAEKDATRRKQALADYSVETGVPVTPQLCQILGSSEEVIEKMSVVVVEPKYDGLRVQIHINKHTSSSTGPEVRVYTRNLEDASHMFPELSALVPLIRAESVILDGEAIGYDKNTGALLPFQETITRKRKHDIAEVAQSVPLKFFIFDVIAIAGESLLVTPLQERKNRLKDLFTPNEQFSQTEYIVTTDPKELQTFHNLQLAEGLEGVVIKAIDSPYQSGRKGWYWVKMKHAEGEKGKLKDTLDCIVMGYYFGRGKRTTFGIGAFLVGVLTDDGAVVTIAKIGTGITDEVLAELKSRCDELKVAEKPALYTVAKELTPDVWVRPELVVEIAADELTRSPMHSAGLALRFPRLERLRKDKSWQDATTLALVKQML
ncbi:ATP-dependent DNA ligase [Candidatus Woesebacteria bacterium]|nr:ATP-dependent DNA ligase [Candidatus Woesebacteria bacterium]